MMTATLRHLFAVSTVVARLSGRPPYPPAQLNFDKPARSAVPSVVRRDGADITSYTTLQAKPAIAAPSLPGMTWACTPSTPSLTPHPQPYELPPVLHRITACGLISTALFFATLFTASVGRACAGNAPSPPLRT